VLNRIPVPLSLCAVTSYAVVLKIFCASDQPYLLDSAHTEKTSVALVRLMTKLTLAVFRPRHWHSRCDLLLQTERGLCACLCLSVGHGHKLYKNG